MRCTDVISSSHVGMALTAAHEVTRLLKAESSGDQDGLEELAPLVQHELHRVAHRYMVREKPGHILQTTALINEVYLQLPDVQEVSWHDRTHFFAICARLMRHILTDYARSRQSLKRGADARHLSLDELAVWASESCGNLVALWTKLVSTLGATLRTGLAVKRHDARR